VPAPPPTIEERSVTDAPVLTKPNRHADSRRLHLGEHTLRTQLVYAALLALSGSLLASCSSAAPTPPAAPVLPAPIASSVAPPPAPTAPAPTTPTAAGKDSRGFIPKKLGQEGGLGSADGSPAAIMSFAVDKITVDPKCGQYGSRAAGKHTIVLDFRVSTGKLGAGDASNLSGLINPFQFQVYDAEGVSHSSQPDMCADHTQTSPIVYASNSKYRFQIAFSTDAVPAEVVLASTDDAGTLGWAWKV
jgi:hypothetical protein